jgi:predicted SPOUT superfamily RNA methylase MTH1
LKRKNIAIAIPASVVSDTPHLREKTSKIGLIGRAAAIFGVGEIIIYKDELRLNQKADMDLIATLLSYMETPQYLRKKLFKLKPELRYAGILPPLRTPHHPLGKRTRDLKVGEYREGVTVSKSEKGMLVDVGVDKLALIPEANLPLGKRVTVKNNWHRSACCCMPCKPRRNPLLLGIHHNHLGKLSWKTSGA